MKSITQTKIWQLPVALRLVVIWFFLLGWSSFWKTVSLYIETKSTIEIGSLILGIIEWSLAIGLINKDNGTRKWAAFIVFLASLFGLLALTVAVFQDPNSTDGLNLRYDQLTHSQSIVYLVAYLILNMGILFTLLRSKTKEFFHSKPAQKIINDLLI